MDSVGVLLVLEIGKAVVVALPGAVVLDASPVRSGPVKVALEEGVGIPLEGTPEEYEFGIDWVPVREGPVYVTTRVAVRVTGGRVTVEVTVMVETPLSVVGVSVEGVLVAELAPASVVLASASVEGRALV